MRYGEDSYGDEGNYLDDFAVYNPANNLAVTPAAETAYTAPALTPEFLQQLQQGAAAVGNAAQSGGLSSLFAPGTLSQLDPLYNYAKTAPIYDLAGNASTEQYKFQPLPDTKYRLVVNKDVIGEASTPAEAARLAELYNQYSSSGGNNIYVAFQKETPTADAQGNPTTTYIPFFENQNEKNRDALFQSMMMAAGAIMGGAALGPALGGTAATATAPATAGVLGSGTLAGIAGTGLGTAAGTFAGGIGSGVPLDEALKRAAISGVTAGVLKGVMPGGVGDAAAGKTAAFAPGYDIAVAPAVPGLGGTTLALPAFSSPFTGVGAGLVTQALPAGTKINEFGALVDGTTGAPTGSLGFSLDLPYIDDVLASMPNFGAAAPLASAASSVPGDLVVTGLRTGASALPAVASALPAVANIVGAQEVLGNQPTTPREETTVTGNRIYDQAPTGPLAAIADAVAAAAQPAPPTEDITVTQQRPQDIVPPSLYVPPTGGLPTFEAPPTVFDTGPLPAEEPTQTVTQQRPQDVAPPASDLIRNIVGAAEVLGTQPATAAEEALVTGKFMDDTNIGGGLPAAVGTTQVLGTGTVGQEAVVTGKTDTDTKIGGGGLPAVVGTTPVLGTGTVGQEAVVTGAKDKPTGPGVTVYTPPASVETIQQTAKGISDAPEIVVTSEPTGATGKFGAVLPGLAVTMPAMAAVDAVAGGTTPPSTTDKIVKGLEVAGLALPVIDALTGGGDKGAAGTGTYNSGRGALNPIFSAKLPTPGTAGAFTVGGLGPATGPNPLAARSVADYYRYAMGPAMDLPAGVDLSRATSPYAGFGPGTLGEETFNRITTGMARGGPMGYARGSSRESFAVEGPGTGRSDDIPAVLSDGEYVIDAETVALLGDGSSRAGAKKLDELRVKVRKHKGKNLAKGKFSVNAKHPEAYMRGGRI